MSSRSTRTRLRALTFAVALLAASIPAATAQARLGDETLRRGDTGSDVRALQRELNKAGYETDLDGEFGRHTFKRVRAFEGNEELKVDGKVTPTDVRVLKRAADRGPDGEKDLPEDSGTDPGQTEEAPGSEAGLGDDGFAVAPTDAPQEVKDVIDAGNKIAKKPYKYGGGHAKLNDSGYDCSGSISYALRKAGLMEDSMPSGAMMKFGERGRGKWITIRANSGHAYMIVAGLRFDTSARKRGGTRWTTKMRSAGGYTARHPAGF
jgi:peptidoglycan hydrolase-like protein with peptidoglycan-binding domain